MFRCPQNSSVDPRACGGRVFNLLLRENLLLQLVLLPLQLLQTRRRLLPREAGTAGTRRLHGQRANIRGHGVCTDRRVKHAGRRRRCCGRRCRGTGRQAGGDLHVRAHLPDIDGDRRALGRCLGGRTDGSDGSDAR